MSIGLLMPGQGSQKIGMGLDFMETDPSKEIFEKSRSILDWDLVSLIKNGPVEQLSNTKYCQPAIFTTSCAVSSHLKNNNDIKAVSGHSLGQFAAAYFCGSYSFEEGLGLVAKRSQIMDEYSGGDSLGMAAVLGLEPDIVKEIVEELDGVYCANFNSAQQIVISGPSEDLDKSSKIFISKGAKRVIKLSVSGAFHSPYMEQANNEFKKCLNEIEFGKPFIPMISNIDGSLLKDAQAVKGEFCNQMTSSVNWIAVIERFAAIGTDALIEIAPGNVLTGFSKRINNRLKYNNLDNIEALRELDYELA